MSAEEICPECGASLPDNSTCEEAFYQMLFWENEDPQKGIVHHLMVLAYHLQHPSLYTPEGLHYACRLLAAFVDKGISPQQVGIQNQSMLRADRRKWKIRGQPGSRASYKHPICWSMTAYDVVNAGADHYFENVHRWVRLILADLRSTQNLYVEKPR